MKEGEKIQYLFLKNLYLFPKAYKVFVCGGKLIVENKRRKVHSIAGYIEEKQDALIGFAISGVSTQIYKEYKCILDFFEGKRQLNFLQFEYATGQDLPLCTFFKPVDFIKETNLMRDILREMPYLENIFKRPLIHLKESDIVQPVDAVMSVNHNTIRHLSTHVENWASIKRNGEIVPFKLLTRVYDDDYGIYENLVFRDLIDEILMFLRKRVRYLTEILETFKESIKLDTVNRINHQRYYLAIGKLYVGFYNTESFSQISESLESSRQIYKQIGAYRVRAVYSKNSNVKPLKSSIKQTNILMMHKDYRHVYALAKSFKKRSEELNEKGNAATQDKAQRAYELFCQTLIVFAASNFNMNCVSKSVYSLGKIKAAFSYKNWQFSVGAKRVNSLQTGAIEMKIRFKDKCVKYLIIPLSYYVLERKKQYEMIVERLYNRGEVYDKYVFFEPYDYDDDRLHSYLINHSFLGNSLCYAVLPISISEINSFRRIQKLLLEMLVLSCDEHENCPFCGEMLAKDEEGYLCKRCRTGIKPLECSHCGHNYFGTYIALKRQEKKDEGVEIGGIFKEEKDYLFRNSVNMREGAFVCPRCGRH